MLEIYFAAAGLLVAVLAWLVPNPLRAKRPTPPAPTIPAQAAAEDVQDTRVPNGQIPEGVTLGTKVVLVPGWQQLLFSHSGHMRDKLMQDRSYSWVERGEVIARYDMQVPRSNIDYIRHVLGSEARSVNILAPVSGLILSYRFCDFVTWPTNDNPRDQPSMAFGVLIADDEPAPEGSAYMFREACDFLRENCGPFFRPSRYWSKPAMTDEQFDRLIDRQLAAECLFVDAMPRFKDYLEEARTKYPSLRPHLRHLL